MAELDTRPSDAPATEGAVSSGHRLGERLRRLRLERGLSQRQLAGDRLTKAFISHLELGRSRASVETLDYLASRLGVPPSALIAGVEADSGKGYLFRAAAASIGGRRAEEAGVLLDKLAAAVGTTLDRARLHRLRAELLELRGLLDEALTEALAAHELASAGGDAEEVTRSCNAVVRVHFRAGRFAAALTYNQRSIEFSAQPGVPPELRAMVLNNGGQIHFALGDSRQALEHFDRASEAAKHAEDLEQLGQAALGAGEAARRLGDMATAVAQAERAQVLFERLEMRRQEARVLLNLGDLHLDQGDHGRAAEYARRARDAAQTVKDLTTAALATERLAHIAALEGRAEDALWLAGEAIDASRQAGDSSFLALAHAALAEGLSLTGDRSGCDRAFTQAHEILDRPGTSPEMAPRLARREVLLRQAAVLRTRGEFEAAITCLERAARLAD